jgi:adenylyltransferase/sulfurtransferase
MSFYFDGEEVVEITARELHEELRNDSDVVLLDVRLQHEYDLCRLPNSKLIPVHELPYRISELDPAENIVVYCHLGIRSTEAVRLLINAGFDRVRNLAGGIDSWSTDVDSSVERY